MIMNVPPSAARFAKIATTILPQEEDRIFNTPDGYYAINEFKSESPKYTAGTASAANKTITYTPESPYYGYSKFTVNPYVLQTVATGAIERDNIVTPTNGAYAFSRVTLSPSKTQTKTVTPTSTSQTITPDSGYYGMSKITVNGLPLEQKTVSSITSSDQILTPSSGYYGIGQVVVPPTSRFKIIDITLDEDDEPGYIPNTAGITSVQMVSMYVLEGVQSYYNGVDSIVGTAGGMANIVYGYRGGMFTSIKEFSIVVSCDANYIYIEPGYRWYTSQGWRVYIVGI